MARRKEKRKKKARHPSCPAAHACAVAKERDALLRQVRHLEQQVAELKVRVETERRKLFKANKAKDDAPDEAVADDSPTRGKKKRGAPVGHKGWYRPVPEKVDRTVEVDRPVECPHCGCHKLEPTDEPVRHVQEDIVLVPRTVATEIVLHAAQCPVCKRIVTRPADELMPQCQIGPVAQSVSVYLRHGLHLPLGKVQRLMKDLFGMSFVPATAMWFGRRAARNGAGLYQEIIEAIRKAVMAHADETGIHVDGVNWWVWIMCTAALAAFRVDPSRSRKAAQALLGKKFAGTLVADDYKGYNRTSKYRQSCLAHPIRVARELAVELARSPLQHRRSQAIAFCNDVKDLLVSACKAHRRLVQPAARLRAKAVFTHRIRELCALPVAGERVEKLRDRLLRTLPTLFTFLAKPGVPPTNNAAERALRPIVVFRKMSGGLRSAVGANELATMASLLLSVKLQKGDPLAFLQSLVVNNVAEARRAIFPDTS